MGGLCVFGRLRYEPGWIMLKSLTNDVAYGQYQPENFFADANLNAMHFGTQANMDSPARSNIEHLESFHILDFKLSDFEDRGEVSFASDSQNYQPSFNSETEGEIPSGETTPEHRTFLTPANLNPLQSSLYILLNSKPRGFSIDLDVFDTDEQRKDKLIAKREQDINQHKDKLIANQSREQSKLDFVEEDIKDALDLEMKRIESLKEKLTRPPSSKPRNGNQSQSGLKPDKPLYGYGGEINREDSNDDEDAQKEKKKFLL